LTHELIFAAAVQFCVVVFFLGKMSARLNNVEKNVDYLNTKVDRITDKLFEFE